MIDSTEEMDDEYDGLDSFINTTVFCICFKEFRHASFRPCGSKRRLGWSISSKLFSFKKNCTTFGKKKSSYWMRSTARLHQSFSLDLVQQASILVLIVFVDHHQQLFRFPADQWYWCSIIDQYLCSQTSFSKANVLRMFTFMFLDGLLLLNGRLMFKYRLR